MNHTCSTLIVHCIDFRLQQAIKNYLEENSLLGDCDIVSIAGSVKNAEFVLEQITISKRLHDAKQVILINHTDCGAYGGSKAFGSREEELSHHRQELENMKSKIAQNHPDLEIKTLVAIIHPTGEVILS